MSNSVASSAYLGFSNVHLPTRGMPSMKFENRTHDRQLLIDQGKVEDSNMILPNMTYVKDYVRYAHLNYCSDKQLKKWDCRGCKQVPNGRFVSSFDSLVQGGHGYVAVDRARKRIVISFRGTNNKRNVLMDLLLIRQPLSYANDTDVTVSTGFLSTMESLDFITPLQRLIGGGQYADYKIAFVGHSLGAAVASLALIKAQATLDIDWKRLELYTYGEPRVGNSNFARWFNQKPIASARVVNNTDPVSLAISTTISDYRHHMNELWIEGPPDSYKLNICSTDQLEDPDCSYKISPKKYTEWEHSIYFGVYVSDEC
ncbi:hypothetical protein DSO57_1035853 [Entomophthora muscae]|uniref:Uncharacterized protein n=1 Tax=Entomophthora muscae TaxID=34485 RepID=A0ACC2RQF1_9FUNG|nr:hypothetical protein DSO57_1035853 [Entomophthora muscae]